MNRAFLDGERGRPFQVQGCKARLKFGVASPGRHFNLRRRSALGIVLRDVAAWQPPTAFNTPFTRMQLRN